MVDPTPISNPKEERKGELCKSTDCTEKTESRSAAPTVDFQKPLSHVPQAPSVVSFAAKEGIDTASVNGVQKPGPRFEDSEFRAGLAALAKLKLTTKQGLGKEELPPWGAWRPASGPENEEKFGEVEAAQSTERKMRDGLVESSIDEKTEDKLGGRSSEQKLEDAMAESGERVVRLEEGAGKSKWGLGFGRFGRKSSGMGLERKSGAEKRRRNGTESVTGTEPGLVKRTGEEEDGRGEREEVSGKGSEGAFARGEGTGRGVDFQSRVKREGKKEGGSKSKKRRKEETGPVEDGVPSAVDVSSGVAKQLRVKQGLQKERDLGRATEKGSKKGLLRKALTLKRSKTGKAHRKEVAGTASEGVTRGDAAEAAGCGPLEACHVTREARARDTPVKFTLEGVKIVVLPKEGADDVSDVAAGGMGEEVDVGTPKATSAGGEGWIVVPQFASALLTSIRSRVRTPLIDKDSSQEQILPIVTACAVVSPYARTVDVLTRLTAFRSCLLGRPLSSNSAEMHASSTLSTVESIATRYRIESRLSKDNRKAAQKGSCCFVEKEILAQNKLEKPQNLLDGVDRGVESGSVRKIRFA
jgi:hypothetical protein